MLVRYLRDVNRVPFACVVAFREEGKILVGWSQCNPTDQFRKVSAKFWAIERARYPHLVEFQGLPAEHTTYVAFINERDNLEICTNERTCILNMIERMQDRAEAYLARNPNWDSTKEIEELQLRYDVEDSIFNTFGMENPFSPNEVSWPSDFVEQHGESVESFAEKPKVENVS